MRQTDPLQGPGRARTQAVADLNSTSRESRISSSLRTINISPGLWKRGNMGVFENVCEPCVPFPAVWAVESVAPGSSTRKSRRHLHSFPAGSGPRAETGGPHAGQTWAGHTGVARPVQVPPAPGCSGQLETPTLQGTPSSSVLPSCLHRGWRPPTPTAAEVGRGSAGPRAKPEPRLPH